MTCHAGSRHPVWMAERDGAAADVEPVIRDAQSIPAINHLAGKGFVQLPQVDIVHLEPMTPQQLWHSENRTSPHFIRITSSYRNSAAAAQRLQPATLSLLSFHEHAGGAAI